jgi:Helicase C-terminal domain
MDEFIQQLFPYVERSRISTLSCGHIIPDTNLLAWPVSNGVDGSALDFTFEKRSQPSVLESLEKSLIALAGVIPHGLVAFFPSYGYLSQCIRAWTPNSSGIWTQLSGLKELFTDSKEVGKIDDILRTYSDAVFCGNGAMLFSVVGGKMSEGINFSDELDRRISIIGLPFPNVHRIEWKTKLQYVQQRTVSRGGHRRKGLLRLERCMKTPVCAPSIRALAERSVIKRTTPTSSCSIAATRRLASRISCRAGFRSESCRRWRAAGLETAYGDSTNSRGRNRQRNNLASLDN